jgi:hypothetical protein
MSTRPQPLSGGARGPTTPSALFVGGALPLREVGVVEDSLADAVNDGVGEFVGNVPFFHMAFRVLAPTAAETPPQHAVPAQKGLSCWMAMGMVGKSVIRLPHAVRISDRPTKLLYLLRYGSIRSLIFGWRVSSLCWGGFVGIVDAPGTAVGIAH